MPAVFALTDKVIQQPQTSLVAAFGSFALLVLVEFGGPPRTRLLAYLGLAAVGAAYITLGTLCSRNEWVAAGAMAVIGFVTLLAGAINGYFAAASTGALLTFVLPVTLPAPNSAIPDRLEGWALASAFGICAVMLLWPPRRRTELRRAAASTLSSVAELLEAGRDEPAELATRAREAVDGLGRGLPGTQHRPTGPVGPMAALASLPEELDWLLSFLAPSAELPALDLVCAEDEEALAAAAALLRASAGRLEGRKEPLDFARLDAARYAVARALVRRLPELPVDTPEGEVPKALESPFRIRAVTYSARQVAGYALLATGAKTPELDRSDVAHPQPARAALEATEQLAVEHASPRSVWFQNSVRGAAGLAIAVFIAQRTGLQHGFWVVLGTLSVLRSNALGTGWSIVSALAGTAVGLVIGALLVTAIGTHEAVLWGVLPVAILLAAYARGADYVLATTQHLIDGRGSEEAARADQAADTALHRLDDAFRQYLTERSATAFDVEDVGALVGGASRVRRAGLSLSTLGLMADGEAGLQSCGENLERELHALQSWYVTLGYSLENRRTVPPPHIRDAEGNSRLLACIRQAAGGRDKDMVKAALMLLWASQHLENLWRLEARLGERANVSTTSPQTGRLHRLRLLLG